MSSRGPSEASKKQTNAFIKPEKTNGFSRFCDHGLPMRPTKDPRATQKTPKDLQHPCKNKPKKKNKNTIPGKKCLKPAISFLTNFEPNFPSQNCTFLNRF